jgi:hypothetical protein
MNVHKNVAVNHTQLSGNIQLAIDNNVQKATNARKISALLNCRTSKTTQLPLFPLLNI